MSFQFSPFGNDQFFDSNGNLAVGFQLFTYLAGTSTKEAVAAAFNGSSFHTNPIILNSIGVPPAPIYLDIDKAYKFVYATPTDTDPPASPIYTADDITVTSLDSTSEWLAGTVPTFISASQFSVVGDQRPTYHVGRRVKLVAVGSTVYGTISVTAFAAVTTVTVIVDNAGSISASIASVFYSILSANGSSWPSGYNIELDSIFNGKLVVDDEDVRTSTVIAAATIGSTTSGSPSVGIGTGILIRAESADEVPSNFGQLEFVASDVGAGTEDTYFQILMRVAGAALSAAYRFVTTTAFRAIFTHGNTADRTYTLPNRTTALGVGDVFVGPSSTGASSTAAHGGDVTISASQALDGIHFYTNFTLDAGDTVTLDNNSNRLIIIASDTITINGTIDGIGAAFNGAAAPGANQPGTAGGNGFSQPGGGGGGAAATDSGGNGGAVLLHGLVRASGGAGGTPTNAGTSGTSQTGDALNIADLLSILGGAGGGSGASAGGAAGAGGDGGGSIVLVAPTIILGASSVLNSSGQAGGGVTGDNGGGGGGGAGNIYMWCQVYTNNGATFTMNGGSGGSGGNNSGGNGAAGVRQINIYA